MRRPFDAIFCRNVMIYFDKQTQYDILSKFVPLLHPDGLLFAGHSESFHHAADLFKLNGKTVYQVADKTRSPPWLSNAGYRGNPRAQPLLRPQLRHGGGKDPAWRVLRHRPRHAAGHGAGLMRCGLHPRPDQRHRRHEPLHAAGQRAGSGQSAWARRHAMAPTRWKC